MDGKLLVLCGERPTINSQGDLIDEEGYICQKRGRTYFNYKGEPVQVDEHKNVINSLDLLNPMTTESINRNVLFVDWDTILPSDVKPLIEMKRYALSTESIPPEFILKQGESDSIMKRAYFDMLMFIDKVGQRPLMNYGLRSMEVFMRTFLGAIINNRITAILPGMPKKDERHINIARFRVIKALKERMRMIGQDIDILHFVEYSDFEEIYSAAQNEMMKIYSKSNFKNEEQGCEER